MRLVAVLDDVPSAALTLHTAGQLAERLGGADLCVFHPMPTVDPDFQSPDEGLPDPAQQARFAQSVAAHASTLHQIFASWQATLPGSTHAHWLEQAGDIRTILPAIASTADFVVLGPTHPDCTQATRQIFATTLYATQAAVLITPPVAQGSLGLHPVVAWQNSPNLLRAVHSAMPLLLTAQQVTILMGEHQPGTPPTPHCSPSCAPAAWPLRWSGLRLQAVVWAHKSAPLPRRPGPTCWLWGLMAGPILWSGCLAAPQWTYWPAPHGPY
nr:universal stress protein [Acetobacter okinawensis]